MENLSKFGKHFALTLAAALLCAFAGVWVEFLSQFIENNLTFGQMFSFSLLHGLLALTSCIVAAFSLAVFLIFRRMAGLNWPGFFRQLARGLFVAVPLSAALYVYGQHLAPRISAAAAREYIEMWWNFRPYRPNLEEIDIVTKFDKVMFMPARNLAACTDSLRTAYLKDADRCERLLARLPEQVAREAYEYYRLDPMGVTFRCAAAADTLDLEKWGYKELISDPAADMRNSLSDWRQCVTERYRRTLPALWIVVAYIFSAFTGYLLRFQSLKRILGVLAVLIVAFYAFYAYGSLAGACARRNTDASREAATELRRRQWQERRPAAREGNAMPERNPDGDETRLNAEPGERADDTP